MPPRTDLTMEFEERAAIMEYDGGLTREKANIAADSIVFGHKRDDPKCPLNAKPWPDGPCDCAKRRSRAK